MGQFWKRKRKRKKKWSNSEDLEHKQNSPLVLVRNPQYEVQNVNIDLDVLVIAYLLHVQEGWRWKAWRSVALGQASGTQAGCGFPQMHPHSERREQRESFRSSMNEGRRITSCSSSMSGVHKWNCTESRAVRRGSSQARNLAYKMVRWSHPHKTTGKRMAEILTSSHRLDYCVLFWSNIFRHHLRLMKTKLNQKY